MRASYKDPVLKKKWPELSALEDSFDRRLKLKRTCYQQLAELKTRLRVLIEVHKRPVGDPSDPHRSVKEEHKPVPIHLLEELLGDRH